MDDETFCPICLEEYSRNKYILKDGNLNQEIDSNCKHWFCIHCLEKMFQNKIFKCPICREDITRLVSTYYHPPIYISDEEIIEDEESEEEDEENYENQIEIQQIITEYNDENEISDNDGD